MNTAEQYEKLKPNHGQPLNVWRVELVVANYSGKVLDYLNAHLNVESDWPPCDNWDGLGNYGKPVVWTGPLMSIQDVGSVEPGEERRGVEAGGPVFGARDGTAWNGVVRGPLGARRYRLSNGATTGIPPQVCRSSRHCRFIRS